MKALFPIKFQRVEDRVEAQLSIKMDKLLVYTMEKRKLKILEYALTNQF